MEIRKPEPLNFEDDDLDDFQWDYSKHNEAEKQAEPEDLAEEEDTDDLLGGFLAKMNQ
ncbi:hypothetical protein ACIQXV_24730 [Neobacillus sp. NPDC097160]|uniref:hypothetical protein n=1 Tax=Neobacillus sp. NPDC097160 TaxID=3364298 RepID=UPI00380E0995